MIKLLKYKNYCNSKIYNIPLVGLIRLVVKIVTHKLQYFSIVRCVNIYKKIYKKWYPKYWTEYWTTRTILLI
jgi:hypothetical protein